MANLVDSLGFEEVNQSVTSTAIISGTNVYGATSVRSPLIVGTNISGTTAIQSPIVWGTTLSGTNLLVAGSASADGKRLSSVGVGSPTVWGSNAQYGSFVTGAGSNVVISFGTAFSSAPTVVVGLTGVSTSTWVRVAGTSAGSCVIESETAAHSGAYIALL